MSKGRSFIVAAGLAVALVAIGGTALASIPDAQGVIHGCYDSGGNLRVIDTSVTPSCPKGYSELDWGKTGPQGAAGAQGPEGPQGATGPQGPVGQQGPAGSQGAPGAPGAQGQQGPQGPAGADGNTVLSGTGAPDPSVGNVGDFYLDTAADVLYGPKTSIGWPTGTSLIGQAGQQGPQGTQGPAGAQGPQGPAGSAGPSTAGSAGLDVQIVSSSGTLLAVATCPTDHPYVIGGGADTGNGDYLQESLPSLLSPGGWVAVSGPGLNAPITAWAICAK